MARPPFTDAELACIDAAEVKRVRDAEWLAKNPPAWAAGLHPVFVEALAPLMVLPAAPQREKVTE